MHIIHEEIGLPQMAMTTSSGGGSSNGKANAAQFVIAPLPNGYGVTLGNALRRPY